MISATAYFLEAPGSVKPRTVELDALASEWVRVRFLYCGLCGTDLSAYEGRQEVSYPLAVGHEFVGEVLEVGDAVTALVPGDVVTSDLNYRCGVCDQCAAGRSHLCRDGAIGLFSNRGFADQGDLHERYLIRVDGPASRQLAMAEPLSCVLHAKEWADVQDGERVLVIGSGSMGFCLAFALWADGRARPFDITDTDADRLALVARAAAPIGTAVDRPDREYDVVFDVSGSESGLHAACDHVRPGGRLCTLSHLGGYSTADFLLEAITYNDITFKVSFLNGELETLRTAAQMLAERWTPAWDAAVEVLPLEDLQQAYERRRGSPWCKTLVRVAPEAP
jgi:threonine dehydrogenase-like Zn-dependent dehydrogenase